MAKLALRNGYVKLPWRSAVLRTDDAIPARPKGAQRGLIGHATRNRVPKSAETPAISDTLLMIAAAEKPPNCRTFMAVRGIRPTTDDRGVPGSSPGLAIREPPAKAAAAR
jgi:hypothetical protein